MSLKIQQSGRLESNLPDIIGNNQPLPVKPISNSDAYTDALSTAAFATIPYIMGARASMRINVNSIK